MVIDELEIHWKLEIGNWKLVLAYSNNKEFWNNFLLANSASFLQSFEWAEFQEKLGRKVWRLTVENDSNVLLQALVVKKSLPLGKSYLYIPFGPCLAENITENQKQQATSELLGELQKIAKTERAVYCYIEPWKGSPSTIVEGLPFHFHVPQKHIQPQQTLVIDLLPSEEQIFRALKSKTTRYNIRFAKQKGEEFVAPQTIGDNEIDIFYNLAQQSAKRDKFVNYSKSYFKNLFAVSSEQMPVKLFFAKFQNQIIAANIFVFFGKTAVHLFGGFNHEFRHLMAPYFMHWNQALFAKNQMRCEIYDFWGIDEKKWPGVTHFKRSFGGKEITYPRGYDIAYNKFWYGMFKTARIILRK